MYLKIGLISFFIVCVTFPMGNGQEIQMRVLRKAGADCSESLAAKPEDCCKIPKIFEESIVTKCKADFGNDDPHLLPLTPGLPPPGCCVSECVLNATKIMVDGKFDRNQAITVIKASTPDSKWVDIITKALDTCEKELSEMRDKMPGTLPPSDPASNKCHPISGGMISCVMINMFQNCPDFSSDANCTKLKAQIPTCPIALMKKQ